MKAVISLVNRNRKLFFKDKGMLFSSMITPVVLIVLYATFLEKVYRDTLNAALLNLITVSDKLINATVAAQLSAALLAVSCVTVTFCVNLTMIQDRANGNRKDFNVSPINRAQLYLGYFITTVLNSLMINGVALLLCLGYIYKIGWYMSVTDVLWVILDEIILVLFGSVLSSIICFPLTTQGQLSAVVTIISAGYGFISGAYLPIANFGTGLQKALSYIPSTYGTSLIKNHMLQSIFKQMEEENFSDKIIDGIKAALDCSPQFHDKVVRVEDMFLIMGGSILVLGIIYFLMTCLLEKENR